MFKYTVTKLNSLPKSVVKDWLSGFETILYDCDGVLWDFEKAIDGTVETYNQLQATGRNAFLVSNHSCITCEAMLKKARKLGYKVNENHAINSALAVAHYLETKNFKKKVYVVGGSGIVEEIEKANICAFRIEEDHPNKSLHQFTQELKLDPEVGAVVVGRDDHFRLTSVIRACNYLAKPNTLFLGTCLDAAYPIAHNRVLVGAAAMIAAVKTMSGRTPLILGKPNPWIVKEPMDCAAINPETTLMIGDTMETDIQLAHYNGFQSILVGTGVNTLEEAEKLRESDSKVLRDMVPDTYLPTVSDLRQYLT